MLPLLALMSTALLAAAIARVRGAADAVQERWFIAVGSALLCTSLSSLVLARFGWFSPGAVATLQVSAAVLLFVWAARHPERRPQRDSVSVTDVTLLGTVAVLIVFYGAFPTYYLIGGRDPGPYLVFAEHIARTGGLALEQPLFAELPDGLVGLIRPSYAAFYSASFRQLSDDPSQLIPQFMHLYPALAANAAAAFGIEGTVRVNALVTGIALWGVYAFTTRLVGARAGLAAVLCLGVNPAVLWAARITMTEPLALLIVIFGALLLLRGYQSSSSRAVIVGAGVLGLGVLARVEACLNVIPVAALAVVWSARAERRHAGTWAMVAFISVAALGLLDGWLHSPPYLSDLYERGRVGKLLVLVAACGAVATLLPPLVRRWLAPAAESRLWETVASLGVAGTIGWMAYAYFVRPHWGDSFDHRALRELGWYVTPAAFVSTGIGAVVVLRSPRRAAWLPFLGLSLFCLFVFTWRPSISWDHIWASRRWVVYVIPGIAVLSAAGIARLYQLVRPRWRAVLALGAAGLAAQYVAAAIDFSKPFLFRSMDHRIVADYDHLVESIRRVQTPQAVLTDSNLTASILTYLYGVPTMRAFVRPDAWQRSHEEAARGYGFVSEWPVPRWGAPLARMKFGGPRLERVVGARPTRVDERPTNLYFYEIPPLAPLRPGTPERFLVSRLWTQVGSWGPRRVSLHTTNEGGALQYGPYVERSAGEYTALWIGMVHRPGHGEVDVVSDGGRQRYVSSSVEFIVNEEGGTIAAADFVLPEAVVNLEFRLLVDGEVELTLLEVQLAEAWQRP